MRTLVIDPATGVAGDMLTAAFLAAGADTEEFWTAMASLPIPVRCRAEKIQKRGIGAVKFHVEAAEGSCVGKLTYSRVKSPRRWLAPDAHPLRGLSEVSSVLRRAQLPAQALELALKAFRLLAEAEAAVHGVGVDEVHFHEVGALDAIADIAAASLALFLLKPDRVVVRRIALGGGTVKTEHGVLPVPAPATAKLLLGLPSCSGPVDKELATPTGAALLRAFGNEFGDVRVGGILVGEGFGAGNLELPDRPNAVRVMIYDEASMQESDFVSVLSCAIDDMSGELLGVLISSLIEAGALDALCMPCVMKKGRQGMRLEVVCRPEDAERLAGLVLRESSSLGVRIDEERRLKLGREFRQVMCRGESVTVKLALEKGRVLRAMPEFDSCLSLARRLDLPVAQIYREVEALAQGFLTP
ncbi:MAG: hypothetical protein RL095_2802 [Verrucomicrobiota bacterium]|jgi:uncharacterized protein (TIGR00299 family) protein